MPKTIALVEDDAAIRENYIMALKAQGYSVNAYEDRPSAAEAFNHTLPDLAIIDIGLKDEIEGGFMLCQQLRGLSQTLPIIFFTARDNDVDTISGLRRCASAYLTSGNNMDHMLDRNYSFFRRTTILACTTEQNNDLIVGACKVNVCQMTLSWQSHTVLWTVT